MPLRYVLQAMARRRAPTTLALVPARVQVLAQVLAQVAALAVELVHWQIDVRKVFARANLARRDMSQAV